MDDLLRLIALSGDLEGCSVCEEALEESLGADCAVVAGSGVLAGDWRLCGGLAACTVGRSIQG